MALVFRQISSCGLQWQKYVWPVRVVRIGFCTKSRAQQHIETLREEFRRRLFEHGAAEHRSEMLSMLKRRDTSREKALAIVGHLLHEELLFHHRQFTVALSSLGRRSLWRAACGLLPQMRRLDLEPNTVTYNATLDACRRGQAWNSAVSLLREMKTCAVQTDIVSFSTTIVACDKASQWGGALLLFDELQHDGCDPDQASVSAAIGACATGGHWTLALALLKQMEDRRVQTDVVNQNGVISAIGRAMLWEHALQRLRLLHEHGPTPDIVSYNTAMAACSDAHRWEAALEVFRSIRGRSVNASAVTFNSAMTAIWLAGSDRWLEAQALLFDMQGTGVMPTVATYRIMIMAMGPGYHWCQVLQLLEEMQSKSLGPDREAVETAVSLLGEIGQADHAQRLFRSLKLLEHQASLRCVQATAG
eukprot:TRINITY_DN108188_c0_g1_i1.p1 TRINITY_DN108188_c0_g1~~TRINITY_DN108188_c0_g1_i1.p1  ORF type:complete len:418 (-),score=58.04 TRINITY_DN108188_c0_g1_i1:25-1278(-)